MAALLIVSTFILISVVLGTFVLLSRRGVRLGAVPGSGSPDRHAFGGGTRRFRGGARVGFVNATWPFVELRIDGDHALIRGMGLAIFDDVAFERSTVEAVVSRSGWPTRGVTFRTAGGQLDGVIFWTPPRRHDAVLAAFAEAGWPVQRQ